MGNLEMALDDQPQDSESLKVLNAALSAARKAAHVSGMMLTYRGQMPGKQEPLDLSEICSQSMPRMNGWETLAALRSLSPGIPVILSSGYDEDQIMAGEHAELPQAFLGKPYRLDELRGAINRVLARLMPDEKSFTSRLRVKS
jgi:CheY-like chemotaxis protein